MAPKKGTPVINSSSLLLLVEMLYIESAKAIKVNIKINKKWRISMITSMMILIKYPVDLNILRKYSNLSQINRLIVA
jgi:hypothetical protein